MRVQNLFVYATMAQKPPQKRPGQTTGRPAIPCLAGQVERRRGRSLRCSGPSPFENQSQPYRSELHEMATFTTCALGEHSVAGETLTATRRASKASVADAWKSSGLFRIGTWSLFCSKCIRLAPKLIMYALCEQRDVVAPTG